MKLPANVKGVPRQLARAIQGNQRPVTSNEKNLIQGTQKQGTFNGKNPVEEGQIF